MSKFNKAEGSGYYYLLSGFLDFEAGRTRLIHHTALVNFSTVEIVFLRMSLCEPTALSTTTKDVFFMIL